MAVFSPSVFTPVSQPQERVGITVKLPSLSVPRVGGPVLLVAGLLIAFALTLLASVLTGPAGARVAGPQTVPQGPVVAESAAYPAWTIHAGDTLWSIATQVAPDADPRAVALQLQVLNGLQSGDVLQPGQVLQVPAQSGN